MSGALSQKDRMPISQLPSAEGRASQNGNWRLHGTTPMNAHAWNDVIVAALTKPDGHALHNMIEHMRDCERAKQILFAKGCGKPGMSVAAIAALVPEDRPN